MAAKFLALMLGLLVLSEPSQLAHAANTYNFVGTAINIAAPEDIQHPIYAVMKLTGEGPFDHTDIESIDFTAAGGKVFGYVGRYEGSLDSSSLTFVESTDGRLTSSAYDGGGVIESAALVDNDPPPFNTGTITLGDESKLKLLFGSPEASSIGITETSSLERFHVTGAWIVVPEPTSFTLFSTFFLLALCKRRCLGSS